MQSTVASSAVVRTQSFAGSKQATSSSNRARSSARTVAKAHKEETVFGVDIAKRAAVAALAAAQIALPSTGFAAEAQANACLPMLAISPGEVVDKVAQAASEASGVADQAKGKASSATGNQDNPISGRVSDTVDKVKGAGKAAVNGGIDTKPVSFQSLSAPQISVNLPGPGAVADKMSGAASDASKQVSGAADQAKGNVGASGGSDNPIVGRTADTVDKIKGAGKSALGGGIDTKPVGFFDFLNGGNAADKASGVASDAAKQASGAADQLKGQVGSASGNQNNPISGRTTDTVDKIKGAGKSALGGGIDTKPVGFFDFLNGGKAADKASGVASDAAKQASGAADQLKGNVGASGGSDNPIVGRTSDTVDKIKGAGKSALGGGIDTKPVFSSNSSSLQVNVGLFDGPGDAADKVSGAASDAAKQASGAADQAKGNIGNASGIQDKPISGRTVADTVDKIKGAGKSALGGGIDTKPVSYSGASSLQVNVGLFDGPGDAADKVSGAASDVAQQASGAADQAKGKIGNASGNQDNPISGRTADTVDKIKGAGKSALDGGIDTKPVSFSNPPSLQTNVGFFDFLQSNKAADKVSGVASDAGKQISGAADQAKGNVGASGGSSNPIVGRTSDTVDKIKGAGKSALGGGIDTKPVAFWNTTGLQTNVDMFELSEVKDEIKKASKDPAAIVSGAADQAKGELGASGGSENPIAGRTSDTVDKVKGGVKSTLNGGIDTKPVSFTNSSGLLTTVGLNLETGANEVVDKAANAVPSSSYTADDASAVAKQLAHETGDSNPVADRTANTVDKIKGGAEAALKGDIAIKPISFGLYSNLQTNVAVDVSKQEAGAKDRPKTDAAGPITQLNEKADQIADNLVKGKDKAKDAANGSIATKPVALFNTDNSLYHNVSFTPAVVLGEVGIPSLRDAQGDAGAYSQSGSREPRKSGDTAVNALAKGGNENNKETKRDDSLEREAAPAESAPAAKSG